MLPSLVASAVNEAAKEVVEVNSETKSALVRRLARKRNEEKE